MPVRNDAPAVATLLPRVFRYLQTHPGGGALHVVLGDWNWEDFFLAECTEQARKEGDAEGVRLAMDIAALPFAQRELLQERLQSDELQANLHRFGP